MRKTTMFKRLLGVGSLDAVRRLISLIFLLVCGSQVPVWGQDAPCSVRGPVAGDDEIVGNAGQGAANVKVTVSDAELGHEVYEVKSTLLREQEFAVRTRTLKSGQLITARGIKKDGSLGEECNATVVPANTTRTDDGVTVYKTLMPPSRVKDMFGRRIAKGYIAIQVTIVNKSKKFELVIHDVSIKYCKLLDDPAKRDPKSDRESCESSSQDLTLLRGPAEAGRIQSPRHRTRRIMQGIGTVAATIAGFSNVGPTFAHVVSAFNGPTIAAYETIFPDTSIGHLNRLNDSAYATNTVVGMEQAKVFVAFIPQELLLSKAERTKFWKKPAELFGHSTNDKDLKKLEVAIDYAHIVRLDEVPPVISDVVIDETDMRNFLTAEPVKGYVLGRFLRGASVAIVQSGSLGLEVALNETEESTDNRLHFTILPTRFVAPSETLTFQVLRKKNIDVFNKALTHQVTTPTLIAMTKLDGSEAEGIPDTDLEVELEGTGFNPGDVKIIVEHVDSQESAIAIPTDLVSVEGTTLIKATFKISKETVTGEHLVRVKTSGGTTGAVAMMVKEPVSSEQSGGGLAEGSSSNSRW